MGLVGVGVMSENVLVQTMTNVRLRLCVASQFFGIRGQRRFGGQNLHPKPYSLLHGFYGKLFLGRFVFSDNLVGFFPRREVGVPERPVDGRSHVRLAGL